MEQALFNVLLNAIEAFSEGGHIEVINKALAPGGWRRSSGDN